MSPTGAQEQGAPGAVRTDCPHETALATLADTGDAAPLGWRLTDGAIRALAPGRLAEGRGILPRDADHLLAPANPEAP
jgi:hypothetical protein